MDWKETNYLHAEIAILRDDAIIWKQRFIDYSFFTIICSARHKAVAVYASLWLSVPITFQFHYLHLSRGTGRNWSVLAFRFAALPSPPKPGTE